MKLNVLLLEMSITKLKKDLKSLEKEYSRRVDSNPPQPTTGLLDEIEMLKYKIKDLTPKKKSFYQKQGTAWRKNGGKGSIEDSLPDGDKD